MGSAVQGQTWQRVADLPTAVAAPAVSISDRVAVVTGGVVLGGGASGAVQVLDMDGLTWSTAAATLNTPRYQHAQVTLADGRLLVIGGRPSRVPGQPNPPLAGCEIIAADLSQSAIVGDLPMPMRTPTAHLLPDGRVLAIGNRIAAVFDPGPGGTDQWRPMMALSQPRSGHASVLLPDGSVLVGGGIGRSSFERIDPDKQASVPMRVRLPITLDDLAMVLLSDGRIWVIGGQSVGGATTDRTWLLTVGVDGESSLVEGPRLGRAAGVADHVAVVTANGIVVAGGESQQGRVDTELAAAFWLDPVGLTVAALPPTDVAHDDAVGFSDRGWAYVVGGQVSGSFLGVKVPTPVRAVHRIRLGKHL
jgi:hypothetical protein